eukprot:TRINITY_DN17677_c0_g1_i2.p1 TRINITY_DN17677_c0_g1~~TRINITY_DN17677_c0_g1_i2.p1  ORF type:complete len:207 (-),score=41.20 TRINITY_DN17677_c0_g1_i2:367-987(-)
MKFLEEDKLLTRLFTQNIDGLDYHTGISPDLVCNVHGSIGRVACESCGATMPLSDFCDAVKTNIKDIYGVDPEAPKESTPILCSSCGRATVKPTTVLFGASLPSSFFELSQQDLPSADLLIVAGTSLQVSPANSVVYQVNCPRLIVNREEVGAELGIDYSKSATRDIFAGGRTCDEVFVELSKLLGWQEKLERVKEQLPEQSRSLL